MKVIFYNHFHNGDLHYSRGFVNYSASEILKQIPNAEFEYRHAQKPDTVSDIPNVKEISQPDNIGPPCDDPSQVFIHFTGNELYINTWICVEGCRYWNGTCMRQEIIKWCDAFKSMEEHLNISMPPPTDWITCIPKINYEKYKIDNVDAHMEATNGKYQKRFFVSNGPIYSNQAPDVDFDQIISNIANDNPQCLFYMTQKLGEINIPNVVYTEDIIKKDGCDLNENSYLSTFCDVLVGRTSGPSSFAGCYENLMDENKTMIVCSHREDEGCWYSDLICQFKWMPSADDVAPAILSCI